MKIIKFLLSLAALLALLHFMNYPAQIGKDSIPPVGHFFNPFEGFWQNAEPVAAFAQRGQAGLEKREVPAMKGKVKILFDERMVPHIFAENMEDAVFAQGYVVARSRLWQMDMVSRLSAGRLAEVMGEGLLDVDKLQRRKGTLYGAQKTHESWKKSSETYRLLQAYSDGVNAWVQNLPKGKYPIEFKLMDYAPEQWSPMKVALVKKYMDLTLCSAETDLEATNARQVFGPEMFAKLYPEWNPKQEPIIPKGTKWDFPPLPPTSPDGETPEAMSLIRHRPYEKPAKFIGSNNWALSGSKTASGNPILCNDPHLRLSLPSIWFEVQIHTPEANAYGVCVPGMPGVLIGFNEQVAWGETNVGHDVADWYSIDWTGPERLAYRVDGKEKKVQLVEEKYFMKNKTAPITDTVRWTEWGPVVYEGGEPKSDLAMRWIGHDAPNPNDFQTFLDLVSARGYEDYRKAMEHYEFPAQNFVFAAKNGDIAITVSGKFPMKKKQEGRFVKDGSLSANGWHGFIPKSQVPQVKNPARGFVASANQHSTDPAYPYYYNPGRGFDDYRGRYLVGQLGGMKKITVEDMKKLQNSTYSLLAEEALTQLLTTLKINDLSEKERDIVNRMAVWDFRFEADKVEPVIFDVWWDNFYEMTFDEVMAWSDSISMLKPDNWRLVEFLEKTPTDSIFDIQASPKTEVAADIAHASLKKTLADLADELVNPAFNWSKHKGTSIMHLARIKAFSKMDINMGGTGTALNAVKSHHGPSWRMIVELGDEVKAWGVFPGGQSGNPGSPYYTSGLDKWRTGEYNELFFMKNEADETQPISFSIQIN